MTISFKKNLHIFFAAVFFAVLFLNAGTANAGTLTCNVSSSACTGGEVEIFRMSGTTNAHAQLPSVGTYTQRVCCSGVTGVSTSCSAPSVNVLNLKANTNSHASQTAISPYLTPVCLGVPSGSSVSVNYRAGSCNVGEATLGSMSAATNAHVGNSAAYSTKICVDAAGPTGPDAISYANNTEPTLTDGGRVGQSITISGSNFGADPGVGNRSTAANNVKIGSYQIPTGNVTAWAVGAITFNIPSAINVYSGNIIVTADSQADTTPLPFKVYPEITLLSVSEAKEGDTIATITGTRFGTGAGASAVTIDGVAATSCVWGDLSITGCVVPPGIDDTHDSVTVRVYQGTGGDNTIYDDSASFIILPKITTLTVPTAEPNAAREYSVSDSDGVFTVNGNHFGAAGSLTVLGTGATQQTTATCVGSAYQATCVGLRVPDVALYTGDIVLTRTSDSKIFTYNPFRVLPRIISNTPTAAIVGNVVQIDGDHLCQNNAICPGTPPTASDKAEFGATPAISSDFVTTPNCTGGSKWSNTQICVKVPSGTPLGSQPTKITSNDYVSNTQAFTVQTTTPNGATNLRQFKSDGTTIITTGTGKTNETTVKLKADLSADFSIAMILQVEVKKTGTAFDETGIVDGTGCTGTSCPDTVATITGLTDTGPDGQYKWRARTKNTATSEVSAWADFNGGVTAFIVDMTPPAITAGPVANNVLANSATIEWTTGFEPSTTQLQYQKVADSSACNSLVFNDSCAVNNDCTTLNQTLTFGPHQVGLINLESNSLYCYRARSKDDVDNETKSSPNSNFQTLSVSQPAKTTSFVAVSTPDVILAAASSISNFSVYIPEDAPAIKSAYLELVGISYGAGTNSIQVQINAQALQTFDVISSGTGMPFKIIYKVDAGNVNINLTSNTLTITPSKNTYVSSGEMKVTYAYTP